MEVIPMKPYRLLSAVAAACIFVSGVLPGVSSAVSAQDVSQEALVQPFVREDIPKGVFLRMDESSGLDLSLTSSEIMLQMESLVENIALSGMNTIYFEVKPSAFFYSHSEVLPDFSGTVHASLQNLDCLSYLTQLANARNIQVYAVVDPFLLAPASNMMEIQKHTQYKKTYSSLAVVDGDDRLLLDPSDRKAQQLAVDYAVELLERYPVAGIVFEGMFDEYILSGILENRNYTAEFLSLVRGSKRYDEQKIGLVLPYTGDGSDAESGLLAKNLESLGVTDFTMADLSYSVLPGYEETIDALETQFGDASVLPMSLTTETLYDTNFLSDAHQMAYRMCYSELSGLEGFAIDTLPADTTESFAIALDLQSDYSAVAQVLSRMNLGFAQSLYISRPEKELTTGSAQYFIMGTSDPEQTLTMNGEEVPRYGEKGAFGILVALEYGTNEFVFEQGDESSTTTIIRPEPTESTAARISSVVQSSIYPSVNDVVYYGSGKIEFQCRAPSGASVTGYAAGLTVPLRQTTAADYGVVATYYGSVDIPAQYNTDETICLGPLTYTMQYNGVTSTYTSNADLFVAGEDATVEVMVNGYRANVYDALDTSDFTTTLSEGALLSVSQKDYWTAAGVPYFLSSCGGYIAKSSVTILEGDPDITNSVRSITLEKWDQGEVLRLKGSNLPAHRVVRTDEGIAVQLFDTQYDGEIDLSESTLIYEIDLFHEEDELLLDISLNDPLWGYDVKYDGDDTLIFIKTPPSAGTDPSRPLDGVTVVLDPGHGDYDCGALGVPGLDGATESLLNLAVASAARIRLEQLGATVWMTRETEEEFLELDERMQFTEQYYPDFFLSVHHNSVAETTDANGSKGAEIYYHTMNSQEMSENILEALCENTGRHLRGAYSGYYRVTRITCAPAALLETGFVPNPAEYEALCSMDSIIESANAICEGIVASLPS